MSFATNGTPVPGIRVVSKTDAEQASKDQKETAVKQVVANIRSRIVAVGREALSENAERLITHRTGRSSR
jgi:hypothetical protein